MTGNSRRYRFSELRTKEKHEPGYKIPPKVLRRPDKPNRRETRECHRAPQREAFLAGQGSSLEVSSSFDWKSIMLVQGREPGSELVGGLTIYILGWEGYSREVSSLFGLKIYFYWFNFPACTPVQKFENRRFTQWIWFSRQRIACVSYTVFYTVKVRRYDWNKKLQPRCNRIIVSPWFLTLIAHHCATLHVKRSLVVMEWWCGITIYGSRWRWRSWTGGWRALHNY